MDRDILVTWLAEGCSLDEMARRAQRHPSTVSHWLKRHGLEPVHRRHAPRGGLPLDILEVLVEQDLSVREIAVRVDRSPTAVRYWLRRHGLATTARARRSSQGAEARARELRRCGVHGSVEHVADAAGTLRCPQCRAGDVTRWRRRAKRILVAEAGGACVICGYTRCVTALHFHHLDPETKRFAVGGRGLAQPLERLRDEAAKCVLLCANCHAEVEAGLRAVPATMLLAPGAARSVPG
jgi:transposase